jgi:hypothetical protein
MTDLELKYYSNPKMQEKFREAMGEWSVGDRGLFKGGMIGYYQGFWTEESHTIHSFMFGIGSLDTRSEEPIRLPLPIDPKHPERGLCGMVEKFGKLYYSRKDGWCYQTDDGMKIDYGKTPTLALMKALAHQWEIDIEEE